MILPCTCNHTFQDVTYGSHNRVHNYARKTNGGSGGWRCTVCSNVKPTSNTAPAEAAPK